MGKRKDKIGEKYEAYKVKFAGKDEAEILKDAANLEKEINGKEAALGKIKAEEGKVKLQEEIKGLKQEYENLLGYVKHKDEIEKIKSIREKMNSKLQSKKEYKNSIKEELDNYIKENIGKYNEAKNNIKIAKKGLGEVDNNTLYEAEEFKKEFEKTVRSYTTKLKKLEEEMKSLPIAIDKCDLAWRSLFANRSWDEINVRAAKMNYTGKNIEELKTAAKKVTPIINQTAKEVKAEKVEERQEEVKTPIITNTVQNVIVNNEEKEIEEQRNPIQYSDEPLTAEEEKEVEEYEKSMTVRKDESIFRKIGQFFKNGYNRFIDFINNKDKQEVKEEVKEEMPVRDAFIEKLYIEVNQEKPKARNDQGTYNRPPRQEER